MKGVTFSTDSGDYRGEDNEKKAEQVARAMTLVLAMAATGLAGKGSLKVWAMGLTS